MPYFLPEFSRLSDLAGKLMLLETDAAFARLAQETLAYLGMTRLMGDGELSHETRALGILQVGYIAGIEAYEREHPVEKEEG
jgi:hypothetical protein